MIRYAGGLFGLAIIAGASVVPNRAIGRTPSSASCTKEVLPGARDKITPTLLLGRPTHDMLEAGPGLVDRSNWFSPRRPTRVFGQVVRADSILGPNADLVRRVMNERNSRAVVVVPWSYGPGCDVEVWRMSAQWTMPDSEALFSVRMRPESLWVSSLPTFDALNATNYAYAYGPYTVGPHTRWRVGTGKYLETDRSMTPEEAYSLWAVLATVENQSDSIGMARLRAWVRANPGVRTRYPGRYILQQWPLDQRR